MKIACWRSAGPRVLIILCSVAAVVATVAGEAASSVPPSVRGGWPPLMALSKLERGLWELRERGVPAREDGSAMKICVRDPAQLMQIMHPGARCRAYVVADSPTRAVVSYQCEQTGTGYTDLRVETARLVQIQTQGVDKGAPFSMTLEGRRIGE